MKVRWTNESLRLRITPSELGALGRGATVAERVTLPGGGWEVRLVPGATALGVEWSAGVAVIGISDTDVTALTEPEREGIYGRDGQLRLLVEKDYPCAHPHAREAAEPETERFVPPEQFLARRQVPRDRVR